MIKPKILSTPDYPSKSMQYEFLTSGIEWIQRLSGGKWTDYNYHDRNHFSGATLLCSYRSWCRTNFPIQDLLLCNSDDFDLEKITFLFLRTKHFTLFP